MVEQTPNPLPAPTSTDEDKPVTAPLQNNLDQSQIIIKQKPPSNRQKFIFIGLVLAGLLILGSVSYVFIHNHHKESSDHSALTSTPTKNGTLTFFTSEDRKKLDASIDSSTSLADFDDKYNNVFADILDSHNTSSLLGAPTINATSLSEISINGTNPVAGINITPLGETDLSLLKKFMHIFTEEYMKYPIDWMTRINPFGFILSKGINLPNGDPAGGISNKFVIYDISPTATDEEYTRETIHHEIFHIFDQSENGLDYFDPDWPESDSHYKNAYDLNNPMELNEHPTNGFVTVYAQTNPIEDRAEIYAYLFTKTGYEKLKLWTKTDSQLSTKVNYIKSVINRYATMDDNYFNTHILEQS